MFVRLEKSFDEHIDILTTEISAYQKKMDTARSEHPFQSPECIEIPYKNPDGVLVTANLYDFQAGIESQQKRIQILQKMKENQTISKEELDTLKQLPGLRKDPKIAKYPHITPQPETKAETRCGCVIL